MFYIGMGLQFLGLVFRYEIVFYLIEIQMPFNFFYESQNKKS